MPSFSGCLPHRYSESSMVNCTQTSLDTQHQRWRAPAWHIHRSEERSGIWIWPPDICGSIVCSSAGVWIISRKSTAAKLITEDHMVLPLGPFDRKNLDFTQGNQDYFFCAM